MQYMVATCSAAPPSLTTMLYAPTSAGLIELMWSGEGGTRSKSYGIHFWKVLPSMLIPPEAATSKVHVRQIQARHVMEYVTKHVRHHEANDGMSESVKTVVAGRGRSLGPSK
jgi:hypothetical protein